MKPMSIAETDFARRVARINRPVPKRKGYLIGLLVGTAIWVTLAVFLYFSLFGEPVKPSPEIWSQYKSSTERGH